MNNSIGSASGGSDFGGATIGGGFNNTIGTNASGTFIGGGQGNQIQYFADYGAIGGGQGNMIGSAADYATIGGGEQNIISSEYGNSWSTIGGGRGNSNSALGGTIGGGYSNVASGAYATIPGGARNTATGNNSFAAGLRAKALHAGALVWADDTEADFSSTTNKQFAVRANNGVMIQATNTALDLRGGGAVRVAGAALGSTGPVFIHRAGSGNITGNYTTIDHPLCNSDPNAILIVTPNWNPGGAGGTYNTNTIGVWYTGSRWAIFNQNAVDMVTNSAYNVLVVKP